MPYPCWPPPCSASWPPAALNPASPRSLPQALSILASLLCLLASLRGSVSPRILALVWEPSTLSSPRRAAAGPRDCIPGTQPTSGRIGRTD